jgi:excisionase family DNA binding protein
MKGSPAEIDERLLVTKREAARLLSVSIRTLDYQIARKQIEVGRVGRRVLIPTAHFSHAATFRSCDKPSIHARGRLDILASRYCWPQSCTANVSMARSSAPMMAVADWRRGLEVRCFPAA